MTKIDKLLIKPDDIDCVDKFFEHFKIDMPENLKKSMDAFRKMPNLDTQREFRLQISKAFASIQQIRDLDKDFIPVIESCDKAAYEMQFESDLHDTIGEDKE